MNIQIFGTKKYNDTKKAQRYFKERGIKFQFIDMSDKDSDCQKWKTGDGEVCTGGLEGLGITIKFRYTKEGG